MPVEQTLREAHILATKFHQPHIPFILTNAFTWSFGLASQGQEGIEKGIQEGMQRIVLELEKHSEVSEATMKTVINMVQNPVQLIDDAPPTPSVSPVDVDVCGQKYA